MLLTGAGYDWSYQPKPADLTTAKAAPKSQRKDAEMNKVMELVAKSTSIQLKQAQKALNQSAQRTSYILRELTLKGKLNKTGRGKAANYRKPRKN